MLVCDFGRLVVRYASLLKFPAFAICFSNPPGDAGLLPARYYSASGGHYRRSLELAPPR